ncbi:hypothetical protein RFI_32926 [Reticulomyxa filosa]|uniref:Uncharacterized protein n=1 Tax=Reticulomyxa filosa TaxID=46433 RepID=X6LSY1_RETFI|nr:hypothetical protein RFI_32926 [Reticulomyxa filosa]|eukprot:ETO04471.1 hypothetical protein RFI_32926 [Reticulomyxa filosa]
MYFIAKKNNNNDIILFTFFFSLSLFSLHYLFILHASNIIYTYIFGRGHRLLNVPTNPYLPYLFDGEEILMSTRLWTHGYDLYLPDRDIIYHIYEQYYKRPLFWNDNWNEEKRGAVKAAQNRINYILQLYDQYPKRGHLDLRDIDKYSLGKQRDPKLFWRWFKYNFQTKESPDFCSKLRNGGFVRIPTNSELATQSLYT